MNLQEIIDELKNAKVENEFHVGTADWAMERGYNEGLDEAIELLKKNQNLLKEEAQDGSPNS